MGQFGGVNVINAIDPASAANAVHGATSMAERQSRQDLADQETLNNAGRMFAESISQALGRQHDARMQQEQIAAQRGMQQEKIKADKESQTSSQNFAAQQQQQAFQQEQWIKQQEAKVGLVQTEYMLRMQNAWKLSGIDADEGISGSKASPLLGGDVPSFTGGEDIEGDVGGSPGAAMDESVPTYSGGRELRGPDHVLSAKEVIQYSQEGAAKVDALRAISNVLSSIKEDRTATMPRREQAKNLVVTKLNDFATTVQTQEKMDEMIGDRAQTIAKKLARSGVTDRSQLTEVGKVLTAMEKNETAAMGGGGGVAGWYVPYAREISHAVEGAGRSIADMPYRSNPADDAKYNEVSKAYLSDISREMVAIDPTMPNSVNRPEVQNKLNNVLQSLNLIQQSKDDPKLLTPEVRQTILQDTKGMVQELEAMGVSQQEIYVTLESIGSTHLAESLSGVGKDQRFLAYLQDDIANLPSAYREVMGGPPKQNTYSPLLKGMIQAGSLFLSDPNSVEEGLMGAHQIIDEMAKKGMPPEMVKELKDSMTEYYGIDAVKEDIRLKGEERKTEKQKREAEVAADEATRKAKTAIVTRREQKKQDALRKVREEQENAIREMRQRSFEILSAPPPMAQPQGVTPNG